MRTELGWLHEWAIQEACVLTLDSLADWQAHHRGWEHDVLLHPGSDRLLKLTHPGTAGYDSILPPTVWEHLERWRLCNEVFGGDAWLEGVMPSEHGVRIAISQPIVDALDPLNPHPTHEAMMAWLRGHGFEYEDGAWCREADRLVLEDAHIGNFVMAQDGCIVPVDVKLRILPAP